MVFGVRKNSYGYEIIFIILFFIIEVEIVENVILLSLEYMECVVRYVSD